MQVELFRPGYRLGSGGGAGRGIALRWGRDLLGEAFEAEKSAGEAGLGGSGSLFQSKNEPEGAVAVEAGEGSFRWC